MRSRVAALLRQYLAIIGCWPKCDRRSPKNGSCSGAGCCQVDLPKGVQYTQGYFTNRPNVSHPTTRTRKYPCNYITVIESAEFTFNTAYLTSTAFDDRYHGDAPVVMEWAISNTTCDEAKIDKATYACVSDNSNCSTNDAGYVCKCLDGYKGNPYVVDGCTGSFSMSYIFSILFS